MYRYVLILVWIGIAALTANQFGLKKEVDVCGKNERRYVYWFAFVTFLPIIIMAGFRGTNFSDSATYADTFLKLPTSLSGVIDYATQAKKDNSFYLLAGVIKLFIGERLWLYFLILASIQGIILVTVFRKYSTKYLMSIFLFLVSTDYIAWMFNGVRQFLAVTIIFAATGLMLREKYIASIVIIIFASLFHQSALIMIPLFLIARGKAWNKKTIVFIVGALVSIAFISQFTNILDSTLSNTQYADVITNYTNAKDDGTNPLRVVIYSVPALLAFVGRKKIRKLDDDLINFCTNSSLIVAGLYIVSMFTSGIYMGRVPIYMSLYNYILLPWEIDTLFTPTSRKILYGAMIVLYLMFYYFQMHVIWGLI